MGSKAILLIFFFFFFFFSSSFPSFVSIGRAEESRGPHGLANEKPMAFPPSAYDFFNPTNKAGESKTPCAASGCSPLPLAAQVEAEEAQDSGEETHGTHDKLGASGIAGIVFGFVCAAVLAMGAFHVVIKRRKSMNRDNSVRPDA